MRLTAKRRAWLARLLVGPAHRPRGRTGYDCMQAGLSEWNYLDAEGQPISFTEALERFGHELVWVRITADGERITDLGRRVLEEADMTIEGQRMVATDLALDKVRDELMRAIAKFPKFASHHEGFAVLLEEVDELWDEVKRNDHAKARAEAIQVAAMAIRFITDLEG